MLPWGEERTPGGVCLRTRSSSASSPDPGLPLTPGALYLRGLLSGLGDTAWFSADGADRPRGDAAARGA